MIGFAVHCEKRPEHVAVKSAYFEVETHYGHAYAICVVTWIVSWVIAGINGFILCQSTF